jgi:transposase-like protein
VEDLLAERGLDVSYETVRSWVLVSAICGRNRSRGTGSIKVARNADD